MIRLNNVSKRFGTTLALDSISFAIPDNTITALVGGNGAGKTTLLKIMTQIMDCDSGSVEYDHFSTIKEFRKSMGYLPEQRGLYTGVDIETQLLHFATIRGISRKEALSNIAFWLKKFDIQAWRNRNVNVLSKGMQQKVQLISSLVSMPNLIFMDEPLSGLDPINFRYFCSILKEYQESRGATIVLSTQNMKSVEQICSMVAILNKSKLRDFGSISDLKRRYATSGTYTVIAKITKSLAYKKSISLLQEDFSIRFEQINSEFVQIDLSSSREKVSIMDAMAFISKAIPSIEIISCSETIPTMEDIFIEINE